MTKCADCNGLKNVTMSLVVVIQQRHIIFQKAALSHLMHLHLYAYIMHLFRLLKLSTRIAIVWLNADFLMKFLFPYRRHKAHFASFTIAFRADFESLSEN